jgi:hypothetical protein
MKLHPVPKKGTMWLINITKSLPEEQARELTEYIAHLEMRQDEVFEFLYKFASQIELPKE